MLSLTENLNDKKNLLITASTFPRFSGDSEPMFIYDLAMYLSKYFEITVLVPADPNALLDEVITTEIGNIKVVRYRYAPTRKMETLAYPGAIIPRIKEKPIRVLLAPFLLLGLYRAIKKQLKENDYSCVNAHWFMPQGAIQQLFYKKNNPPFLVSGLGNDIWGLNDPINTSIKKRILKRTEKIIIVSNSMREKLYSIIKPDDTLTKEKIEVISMGCDVKKFSPKNKVNEYYKDNFNEYGTIILHVGRLTEKKGALYLINAMKEKILYDTDAKLVIVGDGPLKKSLEEHVALFNLKDRVKFLGHTSHENLRVMYASCDIFCTPSVVAKNGDRDGFLTANIEASASGVPIVTTKHTMSFVENETAYIVEDRNSEKLAKALYELVTNKEERKRLGNNGVEWAKELSWENIAVKYSKVINDIIKEKETVKNEQ
jgi:glycosyltransferase involved in cell wall biosynthesis